MIFFIVGAPKCGTSALAVYLSEHKGVSFSNPKEPHFFSDDIKEKRKIRTISHYENIFPEKHGPTKKGEGSIWYLYSKVAPGNIKKHNENAKIIIMIRDPIDFIESLHNQNVIGGHEKNRDIDFSIQTSISGKSSKFNLDYVELSKYAKYIDVYIEAFGRENVLILLQEELKEKPRETYLRVLDFLSLTDDRRTDFKSVNERRTHKYKILEFFLTRNWVYVSRAIEPLRRMLGVGSLGIYKKVMDFNSKKAGTKSMSGSAENDIKKALKNDMDKLMNITQEDKLKLHWKRFFKCQ